MFISAVAERPLKSFLIIRNWNFLTRWKGCLPRLIHVWKMYRPRPLHHAPCTNAVCQPFPALLYRFSAHGNKTSRMETAYAGWQQTYSWLFRDDKSGSSRHLSDDKSRPYLHAQDYILGFICMSKITFQTLICLPKITIQSLIYTSKITFLDFIYMPKITFWDFFCMSKITNTRNFSWIY